MEIESPKFSKPRPDKPVYNPNTRQIQFLKREIEHLENLTSQSFSFRMNWREKFSLQNKLKIMTEEDLPKAILEYDKEYKLKIAEYEEALKNWEIERDRFDGVVKNIEEKSGNPITSVEIE